jgi:hypothetical protein
VGGGGASVDYFKILYQTSERSSEEDSVNSQYNRSPAGIQVRGVSAEVILPVIPCYIPSSP